MTIKFKTEDAAMLRSACPSSSQSLCIAFPHDTETVFRGK